MKDTTLVKPTILSLGQHGIIRGSAMYYDVNHDTRRRFYFVMFIQDMKEGVRKEVFLFGSEKKTRMCAEQLAYSDFIDFQLVDNSYRVSNKLKARFLSFKSIDPDYFSFDSWFENLTAGRIAHCNVTSVIVGSRATVDLVCEVNTVMFNMTANSSYETPQKWELLSTELAPVGELIHNEKKGIKCPNCNRIHNEAIDAYGNLCSWCICRLHRA